MAVTNVKKQEETAKNTQQVQSQNPYNGLQGVSQNTANNLANYQQGYKPSEAVTAAQQNLQQVQAQKPQNYASKYTGALDNILQQIQNPQQFKYEFNADNLFKNYADLYTQKGKQASLDTMGQAAALTGGYGNSYAQAAGNQAYQQYLLSLYDKGMDLYDRAYKAHQDQLANNYNIYNTLYNADQADYGKYRDTVADWQAERDYFTNNYNTERNFDYNTYNDMLNYYTNLAGTENSAWMNDQQLQEQIRQANLDEAYRRDAMAADRASEDKKYAYNYAMSILQNGQMPSDDILAAAGLSREDAQRMMAQMMEAGTGGGYGGGGGRSGSGQQVAVYDAQGNFYISDGTGNAIPISREEALSGEYMIDTSLASAENMGYTSGQRTTNALNASKANLAGAAASGLKAAAEELKKKNKTSSIWAGT